MPKLTACECDNTHEANQTVCRYCWDNGLRYVDPKNSGFIKFKGKQYRITTWQTAPRGFMGYVLVANRQWCIDIPHRRRPKLGVWSKGKRIGFASYIKPKVVTQ